IGGGTGSDTAALATPRLAAALPTLPAGSFVGIALGTNDATTGVPVATFKAQLQQMITSIKGSGRTPMLARTSWSLNPNLPRYVQAIDELRAANGLPPGPDLYTHFQSHPEELKADRVHPTATGERSIQRLWAEAVARAYGR
ncbi:MAG: SGNH/GDSL hydrolase family protein, partial [Candidatus Sericytochromatia bacterium]